jgi:hypothetical protein
MIPNWIIRKLTARRRNIFRFWNGRRYATIDPMVVFRKLSDNQEFSEAHDLKQLEYANTTSRLQAYGHIAEVIRDAFSLPVFDGNSGLTETELVKLYRLFQAAMTTLKKKPRQQHGSSPSMEPAPDTKKDPPAVDTPSQLDSGLTPQTP